MTEADLARVESVLGRQIPSHYRKFIVSHIDELRQLKDLRPKWAIIHREADNLISDNQQARREAAVSFTIGEDQQPWPESNFIVGTNGGGTYWFVRQDQSDPGLWSFDLDEHQIELSDATLNEYLEKFQRIAGITPASKAPANAIQVGFPPGDLRQLREFTATNDGTISGCFELEDDGRGSALAWFDGDAEAASLFAVFGRGPDGSLYAFWLHGNSEIERAPIVLLDSECDGNAVIASDFREFLRLLAIGYEEPGRYPTTEPEDRESAAALRDWLAKEFSLAAPETAKDIVASAGRQHPGLEEWIAAWQKMRKMT